MVDPRLLLLSSSSCIIVCVCCVLIFLRLRAGKGGDAGGGGPGVGYSPSSNRAVLSLDNVLKKNQPPFNTKYVGNPERLSVKDGVLTIRYAKNAYGGSSGGKFSALPKPLPSEAVEFGFDIYFPDSFEWKKGGKLPGVCLGRAGSGDCAVASRWKTGEGSVRFMWRSRDNKSAYIIAYVYLPSGNSPQAAYKRQGPVYRAATDPGDHAGHDVWSGELPIRKGWNSVRMKIALNTPKKADGLLEVEVNGKVRRANDVLYRDDSSVVINSLNWVSFFGGGDASWASPQHDTYTSYKNVYIH